MDPGPDSDSIFLAIPYWEPVLLVLLIIARCVVAGSETAFSLLGDADIAGIKSKSVRRARTITRLLSRPKRLAATFAAVNTFLLISIVFIIHTCFLALAFPPRIAVAGTILAVFLSAVFTDVIPRSYAAAHKRVTARRMAGVVMAMTYLSAPVSMPLRELTLIVGRRFGAGSRELSVDRLSQALELTDYGDADPEEHRLLHGIVTFGATEARQAMTPRIDIFAVAETESYVALLEKIAHRGLSRIPVFRDNIDNITGVLFVKDLIPYLDSGCQGWSGLSRSPFFVPENIKLDDLLREFQGMKNHLAIVVDEHGATSGIITLEDVLEEIVGDISDEFDDQSLVYSCIDDKNFLFDGKLGLKDFYRITGADEEPFEKAKGGAESLAGFVMEVAGFFPEKGSKINFNGNIFTVESVHKGRIRQIKCTLADEIS